jgi:hypothetical protein
MNNRGVVLEDLHEKAAAKMVIFLTQSSGLGKYREKTVEMNREKTELSAEMK